MKKLFCLIAIMLFCVIAVADDSVSFPIGDTLKNLPSLKHGVMWNFDTHRAEYILTTQVLTYKNISIEAGYDVANSIVGVASYRLGGLKDYGVEVPILELIEFNVGFGMGMNLFGEDGHDEHFTYGPTCTLIQTKF